MKSQLRQLLLATLLLVLFIPGLTMAQMKVGYMNPQKVLSALPERAKIQKELNDYLASKQQEYGKKAEDFRNEVAAYQKKSASMSSDENNKEKQRLSTLSQNLDKYRSNLQKDLDNKRSVLMSPLLDKINKAMKDVADQMNLDFVLNETTQQGQNILLFVSDTGKKKYDITQKVIDKLTKN